MLNTKNTNEGAFLCSVCCRGWRTDAEHKTTPTRVHFRVRHVWRVKERRRTRKHTNDGVFLCSAYLGRCGMQRKDAEHKITPTRVWLCARHVWYGIGNTPNTKSHQWRCGFVLGVCRRSF